MVGSSSLFLEVSLLHALRFLRRLSWLEELAGSLLAFAGTFFGLLLAHNFLVTADASGLKLSTYLTICTGKRTEVNGFFL